MLRAGAGAGQVGPEDGSSERQVHGQGGSREPLVPARGPGSPLRGAHCVTEPPDLRPGADGLLRGQPSLLSESEAWGWNPAWSSSFSLQLWLACLHPQTTPPQSSPAPQSLPSPLAEAPGRKFIFTLSSSFQRFRHSLSLQSPDAYRHPRSQPVLGAMGELERQVDTPTLHPPAPELPLPTDNVRAHPSRPFRGHDLV